MGVKAVGEEDDGTAAVFLLQQIGVELGLLAALGYVHAGALGLQHGEGLSVVAVQDVVGVTDLALVGHTVQLHLVEPVLALDPARVLEHKVDIDLSRLVLGQIQGLGDVGLLLLGAAGGELVLEGLVFLHELGHVDIVFGHEGESLVHREGQERLVKLPLLVGGRIEIGHAIQKNKEIFQTQLCLLHRDLFAPVSGIVADLTDELHPPPDIGAHDVPEPVVVHEADEGILIGHDEIAVNGIHPFDRKLHGPTAVQHAGVHVDM